MGQSGIQSDWSPAMILPADVTILIEFDFYEYQMKNSKYGGGGGRKVYTQLIDTGIASNPVILINFPGEIKLRKCLGWTLPHINPEYGGVCTSSENWVV